MKSATGPMCIRLYRRQDGTLITKDCPVGRRIADACKRRLRAIAMALFACIQAAPAFSEDNDERRLAPRAGVSFAPNKWRKEETTSVDSTSKSEVLRPQVNVVMRGLGSGLMRNYPSPPPSILYWTSPVPASVMPRSKTPTVRADRSALDAFNDAQKAESTGFTSRAAMRYEFAIYQFLRDANSYDPVFKKQVATAYAKFLKKQNQPEQAKAILDEFCKKR